MSRRSRMASEDRRQAILDSARKLFALKGLDGTSTRELAKAAGVTQPLFYHYFPSKEALYRRMLLTIRDTLTADIRKELARPPSAATLLRIVRSMVSWQENPSHDGELLLRYLLHSLMGDGKFAKEAIQSDTSAAISAKIRACIAAAIKAGDLVDSPVDRELRTRLVRFTILSISLLSLAPFPVMESGLSRRKFIDQTTWFLLRGIGITEKAIQRAFKTER